MLTGKRGLDCPGQVPTQQPSHTLSKPPSNPLPAAAQAPYSSTGSLALSTPKNTALLIPTLSPNPQPLFADVTKSDTLTISAGSVLPAGAGKVLVDPATLAL